MQSLEFEFQKKKIKVLLLLINLTSHRQLRLYLIKNKKTYLIIKKIDLI